MIRNMARSDASAQLIFFLSVFLIITIYESSARKITNGIDDTGDPRTAPRITCFRNGLKFQIFTKEPFTGHIYVKGMYGNPNCNRNFTGTTKGPSINVAFEDCIHQRERMKSPPGMMISLELIIQFHPFFTTQADRGFIVSCSYREAVNTVTNNQLLQGNINNGGPGTEDSSDVIPIQKLTYQPTMPRCKYTIHKGSPQGPKISFARVGEMTFHKWQCYPSEDGEFHGVLVHSCFARSGDLNIKLLDRRGCTLDPFAMATPTYTLNLTMAYVEVHAFKFADSLQISFSCSISLCLRMNNRCGGITPPECKDPTASSTPRPGIGGPGGGGPGQQPGGGPGGYEPEQPNRPPPGGGPGDNYQTNNNNPWQPGGGNPPPGGDGGGGNPLPWKPPGGGNVGGSNQPGGGYDNGGGGGKPLPWKPPGGGNGGGPNQPGGGYDNGGGGGGGGGGENRLPWSPPQTTGYDNNPGQNPHPGGPPFEAQYAPPNPMSPAYKKMPESSVYYPPNYKGPSVPLRPPRPQKEQIISFGEVFLSAGDDPMPGDGFKKDEAGGSSVGNGGPKISATPIATTQGWLITQPPKQNRRRQSSHNNNNNQRNEYPTIQIRNDDPLTSAFVGAGGGVPLTIRFHGFDHVVPIDKHVFSAGFDKPDLPPLPPEELEFLRKIQKPSDRKRKTTTPAWEQTRPSEQIFRSFASALTKKKHSKTEHVVNQNSFKSTFPLPPSPPSIKLPKSQTRAHQAFPSLPTRIADGDHSSTQDAAALGQPEPQVVRTSDGKELKLVTPDGKEIISRTPRSPMPPQSGEDDSIVEDQRKTRFRDLEINRSIPGEADFEDDEDDVDNIADASMDLSNDHFLVFDPEADIPTEVLEAEEERREERAEERRVITHRLLRDPQDVCMSRAIMIQASLLVSLVILICGSAVVFFYCKARQKIFGYREADASSGTAVMFSYQDDSKSMTQSSSSSS